MADKIITPTNSGYSNVVKLAISAVYILVPLALLIYSMIQGEPIDSLILLIVVMLIFASAYVIYGERIVDKATEKAEEVSGQEGNGDTTPQEEEDDS